MNNAYKYAKMLLYSNSPQAFTSLCHTRQCRGEYNLGAS